ncbi:MAG: tetratricopeptide repeat protein [Gammaproteobacteria bacterium]
MRATVLTLSLLFAAGLSRAAEPPVSTPTVPTGVKSPQTSATASAPPTAPASALAFQSLAQLDEMVALGMSSLALKLLDDEQAQWPQYSPDWYAFEHKRIILLASSGRWQELLQRSNQLLDNAVPNKEITELIRQWFITQQVVAHLQLKQPHPALQKARSLLWNQPAGIDNAPVNVVLRQLIVRAYLQLDDVDDAQKALQKYQQDYADTPVANDEEWKVLQARVLLRTSRYSEAVEVLKTSESGIARALSMVATVRADPRKSFAVVKSVNQILDENAALVKKLAKAKTDKSKATKDKATEKKLLSKGEVWAFNYVLYERARLMADPGLACIALEKMLSLGDQSSALGDGFEVGADKLWALYEQLGQSTGNENKLLVGDDAGWAKLAKQIEASSPVRATGLYAVLALNSHTQKSRDDAHRALVELVSKNENGLEIVSQLYLRSTRIAALESLPAEVRFRLVDYALTSGQIDLAARLMLTLQEPPEDKNPFDWRMRKARVLVLEGNYKEGVAVLHKAIEHISQLDAAMVDQYFQVLFDLQAVEQHAQALELFSLIKYEWLDEKYQRELYFWKAESNFALKRYAQSAWLYLMSARAVDPAMTDLWSQSARYKAADALVKAKLYDDAYSMYDELLAMTASETRRTWIRQAMQQIELLRNAENNDKGIES